MKNFIFMVFVGHSAYGIYCKSDLSKDSPFKIRHALNTALQRAYGTTQDVFDDWPHNTLPSIDLSKRSIVESIKASPKHRPLHTTRCYDDRAKREYVLCSDVLKELENKDDFFNKEDMAIKEDLPEEGVAIKEDFPIEDGLDIKKELLTKENDTQDDIRRLESYYDDPALREQKIERITDREFGRSFAVLLEEPETNHTMTKRTCCHGLS